MIKRGVLIGCGFFAENHINAWSTIDGVQIVAICDLDASRLAYMGDRFGIAHQYHDAETILKVETPDFADIVTTASSHRKLVELCAPRVATVICQKPFAENLADARAMVSVCQAYGTCLIVHENFRWQRAFMMMKDLLDKDTIGAPHFARFTFRHGYDNYANQPYLTQIERFAIMDVGLHLFDLARLFLGEVAHLSCTTQRLNSKVRGEDAFTALLRHTTGATSICECSFQSHYAPDPFPQTAAVIEGDKGTLELGRDFTLIVHDRNGARQIVTEPEVPAWGAKPWHTVQQSVISFQQHALAVMRRETTPRPSGADNVETLRLALAAYEAAARGATIDMATWQENAA